MKIRYALILLAGLIFLTAAKPDLSTEIIVTSIGLLNKRADRIEARLDKLEKWQKGQPTYHWDKKLQVWMTDKLPSDPNETKQ